jgi:hypothetical protein
MKLDIQLSDKIANQFIKYNWYYSFQSLERFINYLFPANIEVNVTDSADVIVHGIFWQNEDNVQLPLKKVNIMLCIENCSGHPIGFYPHYTKFREYGDPNVNIYFYNHIDRCVFSEKYMAIPVIYTQIDYYRRFSNRIGPTEMTPFAEKKFCLLVPSDIRRIPNKNYIRNALRSLGECDNLYDYKYMIENKSCYHSNELLNLFQRYKFVFVCENSTNNGYITEKIFNCYFAQTIPVYNGSQNVDYYFNTESFINLNEEADRSMYARIERLRDNEDLYTAAIRQNKINDFDDEDYRTKLEAFIRSRL